MIDEKGVQDMENFIIRNTTGELPGDGKITMTHSGIFTRNGEKVVHVCFERKEHGVRSFAEAVIPSCTFLHNEGFAEEEVEALKVYLQMNKETIYNNARQINRNVLFKL